MHHDFTLSFKIQPRMSNCATELRFMFDGVERVITSTLGHPFLTPDGSFAPISEMMDAYGNAEIVLEDEEAVMAQGRLVAFSENTTGQKG